MNRVRCDYSIVRCLSEAQPAPRKTTHSGSIATIYNSKYMQMVRNQSFTSVFIQRSGLRLVYTVIGC